MRRHYVSLAAFALLILLGAGKLSPAAEAQAAKPNISELLPLNASLLACNSGITGSVTGSNGKMPLEDVTVTATLAGGSFSKSAQTDAAGQYTLLGLPAGKYQLTYTPSMADQVSYLARSFNNNSSPAAATPVDVGSGAITAHVDAALDQGGMISGHVTDAKSAAALSNVFVQIYSSSGELVDQALTGEDGSYTSSALGAGSYKVEFLPPQGAEPYLSQFAGNTRDITSTTAVVVTTPNLTGNVDAALALGSQVRGRVIAADTGAGLADVAVVVYDSADNVVAATTTSADGSYATPGLRAGSYKLMFDPAGSPSASQYLAQFSGNQAARAAADMVVVTLPNPSTANAALVAGGQFTGQVTAASTGAPLADVEVQVFSKAGDFVGSSFTDASGVYTTPGLAPGDYKLMFDPTSSESATGYAYTYSGSKPTLASADTVAAPAPGSPSTIDAALDVGGRISGKLSFAGADACGAALSSQGGSVTVYDADQLPMLAVQPDADGSYVTPALPAGSYRLGFSGPDGAGFADVFATDKSSLKDSDAISVAAPGLTPNVDATLKR